MPAVTHEETVVDEEAWTETVIDQAAKPAVEEVSHLVTVVDKEAWTETVIDQAAKPAVEEVSHLVTVVDKEAWNETVIDGYAYRQKQTGKLRWEDSRRGTSRAVRATWAGCECPTRTGSTSCTTRP